MEAQAQQQSCQDPLPRGTGHGRSEGLVTAAEATLQTNRAGPRPHLAQPSVSQAVRNWEKDLHTELFHCAGGGVPAPAGERRGPGSPGPADPARLDSARQAVSEFRDVERAGSTTAGSSGISTDPLSVQVANFRLRYSHAPAC
jgi:DNA-binding transcriptional LysR family regulator